uniref:Histidinol dehydrogenase n=2 Tax=environmental samples TaxID=651140 RepID=A0A075H511_9ARCH|nr:histidinol dehydrogenase (hisD) [uncultured marine thaumarchaeote KM3_201_G07]AIF10265.1 histidinol dehydrogenase (hisD) [uncultured marine thaumarchaeote KM3_44_H07]
MIKILQVRNVDSFVESRRQKTSEKDKKTVQSILNDVRKNGDSAVKKYERKFNGRKTSQLRVSAKEIKEAQSKISWQEVTALTDMAYNLSIEEAIPGPKYKYRNIRGYRKLVPIPSVGCYIPGGQAKYPSSAIMSVVPAAIAGVKRIVVISPPGRDGKLDPSTIVAAKRCGATEIYKVGGAQAIGALAYGTKSIPKVDKIVGPGGKFVSIAKSLVSDQTAVDMVAGPTELGIIADTSSDPELVALDLISQAEHSKDTMCFVITQSKTMAKQIQRSLKKLIPGTERSSIIKESISKNGFIAVCRNQNEMIEFANRIAPEHLELMVKNARSLSKKITGAGLVLIGKNTPSAASDYLLGTNHILPTNGFGRTRGGLSVLDFLKIQTVVESKKSTLKEISDSLKTLTDAEDLPNHYKAVKRRLD